jgi:5-hydroxyisourate hydrolase-like protein (transthyretin family)
LKASSNNNMKIAFSSNAWAIVFLILFLLKLTVPSSFASGEPDNVANPSNGLRLCSVSNVEASGSEDLIVGEDEQVTIQDQVFMPSGDIIVEKGGKLILRNVEVVFNHTGCYEHGIVLKENTGFEIYDSQIRGLNNLFFFKARDTALILEDSTIRMTHVLCGNSSCISIVRSELWALHCFNESTADIENARLHYLFLRGRSSARVDDAHIVEILIYGTSHASVSDATLKNIFYFDEGWAILSNCSYVDLIRFEPLKGNLTITVLDEGSRDPVPMVCVTLERPRGSEADNAHTNDDGVVAFSGLEEGDYFAKFKGVGYVPMNITISLLNVTQHETMLMHRMEEASSWSSAALIFMILMAVVLAVLVLSLFYRSHGRN